MRERGSVIIIFEICERKEGVPRLDFKLVRDRRSVMIIFQISERKERVS